MSDTGKSAIPESASDTTPAGQSCDFRPAAEIAWNIEQAKTLRERAEKAGLKFEAYLPPAQARWFLKLIEQGKFADPADALKNLLGEMQDLEPHADLRKEILKRSLDAALNDPGPPVALEDCFGELIARTDGPQPAVWTSWPGAAQGEETG